MLEVYPDSVFNVLLLSKDKIVYFILLFVVIAPVIKPYIVKTFFHWWPDQFSFQLLLRDPTKEAGYAGIIVLVLFYIILSGILGPLIEELYFRGYLLPRMDRFAGKWAPLLGAFLFSIYHFYSPWENLIRIVASYPLVYTVWKKEISASGYSYMC
jgi:membrane protease YdiL (CAAX protease family)